MIKWILSFSATTTVSGLIAFSEVTGPLSVFAKIFFFFLATLFLVSVASALIRRQWK